MKSSHFSWLGKLTLMKAYDPGFWYQARMTVTNVNIFSSLSLPDMISLTSEDVCGTDKVMSNDYICNKVGNPLVANRCVTMCR